MMQVELEFPKILQRRINAELRVKNRHYSAFARLPQEVAVLIFKWTLHGAPDECHRFNFGGPNKSFFDKFRFDRSYFQILYNLAKVSSSFWTLIKNTPCLWAVQSDSLSEQMRVVALERSHIMPLSVTRTMRNGAGRLQIGKLLRTQGHRIRHLHIETAGADLPDGNPDLEKYPGTINLSWPAPLLERFHFQHSDGSSPDFREREELFSGHAPLLRHVSFNGVKINCGSSIFVHLTTLELENVHCSSDEGLLDVIARSPSLQELKLSKIHFEEISESRWVVTTRHLSSLTITNMKAKRAARLLESINAPACRRLVVEGLEVGRWGPTVQISAFKGFESAIRRALAEPSGKDIEIGYEKFHLSTCDYPPYSSIHIEIPCIQYVKYFCWAADLFPKHPSRSRPDFEIHINILPGVKIRSQGFFEALLKIHDMYWLEFDTRDDQDIVLKLLGNAQMKSGWPFPWLHSFALNGNFTEKAMLDMLKSRYGKLSRGRKPKNAPEPPRLGTIMFFGQSMTDSLYKKVEKIVGSDTELVWEETGPADADNSSEEEDETETEESDSPDEDEDDEGQDEDDDESESDDSSGSGF